MTHWDATMVGHVLLFLSTMAGFAFQWFREARQHRWSRERMNQLSDQIKQNGHAD